MRFNGEVHYSLYPTGKNKFAKKWSGQTKPYELVEGEDGNYKFFGFTKK